MTTELSNHEKHAQVSHSKKWSSSFWCWWGNRTPNFLLPGANPHFLQHQISLESPSLKSQVFIESSHSFPTPRRKMKAWPCLLTGAVSISVETYPLIGRGRLWHGNKLVPNEFYSYPTAPHPSIESPTGVIYYRHYPLITSLQDLECICALSHSECASAEDKSRQLMLHPSWVKQACKCRSAVLWLCHRMAKAMPLQPGLHS